MRVLIFCANTEVRREIAQYIPMFKGREDYIESYATFGQACRAYSRGRFAYVVLPDNSQTSGWIHCLKSQGQSVVILNGDLGKVLSKVFNNQKS